MCIGSKVFLHISWCRTVMSHDLFSQGPVRDHQAEQLSLLSHSSIHVPLSTSEVQPCRRSGREGTHLRRMVRPLVFEWYSMDTMCPETRGKAGYLPPHAKLWMEAHRHMPVPFGLSLVFLGSYLIVTLRISCLKFVKHNQYNPLQNLVFIFSINIIFETISPNWL